MDVLAPQVLHAVNFDFQLIWLTISHMSGRANDTRSRQTSQYACSDKIRAVTIDVGDLNLGGTLCGFVDDIQRVQTQISDCGDEGNVGRRWQPTTFEDRGFSREEL